MEWISVNDKLPDTDDVFLVYPNKYTYAAEFRNWGALEGKFINDDINGYEHEVFATHWMPLPSPPKQ